MRSTGIGVRVGVDVVVGLGVSVGVDVGDGVWVAVAGSDGVRVGVLVKVGGMVGVWLGRAMVAMATGVGRFAAAFPPVSVRQLTSQSESKRSRRNA